MFACFILSIALLQSFPHSKRLVLWMTKWHHLAAILWACLWWPVQLQRGIKKSMKEVLDTLKNVWWMVRQENSVLLRQQGIKRNTDTQTYLCFPGILPSCPNSSLGPSVSTAFPMVILYFTINYVSVKQWFLVFFPVSLVLEWTGFKCNPEG